MDVRCGRCGTEYDFDDALISERGTTVKCTSCGHQFKVFPRSAGTEPERWVVRTNSGNDLVFTSLRDLQRAISRGQVGADDLLSRGNAAPRTLRAIAELEPFFRTRPPGEDRQQPRTLHGVAPPPRTLREPAPSGPQVVVGHVPWAAHGPPPGRTLPIGHGGGMGPGDSGPPPRPDATLPVASHPAVRYAEPAPVASTQPAPFERSRTPPYGQPVVRNFPVGGSPAELLRGASNDDLMRTQRAAADPVQSPSRPHQTVIGLGQVLGQTLPVKSEAAPAPGSLGSTLPMSGGRPSANPYGPTTQPVYSGGAAGSQQVLAAPPAPAEMHADEHRYSSDDLEGDVRSAGLPRKTGARWVFALVLAAIVVLLGVTVGRRYVARVSVAPAASAPPRDQRVIQLLKEAQRLLDQGSFEDAKEHLDKATALADRDPAVLVATARLESVRADTEWLRLRLLDPSNADLVHSTHRELGARVGRAEAALERATKVAQASKAGERAGASRDSAVVRAAIDLFRMKGDLDRARAKIGSIGAAPNRPENAYVLAALDLADPEPAFAGIIDRLRIAASVEIDARRAQAALIYALGRDGQQASAEQELAKVKNASSPHPLLAELENFVGRLRAQGDASPTAPSASVAAVDPGALGALDTSPVPAGGDRPPATVPGDFRATLKLAAEAARGGNAARAEQLYQSALTQHPGDTEALTGLGDLAKGRGDLARAGSFYEQVLRQNPSYLPALMGSADQKWASGDRKGALALYRRVLEQAGPGTSYAQRAQARIKQSEGEHAPAPAAPATGAATAPALPPDVDTSDLKGIE
jgi:predicted Zn finger-like uncharacterized protein